MADNPYSGTPFEESWQDGYTAGGESGAGLFGKPPMMLTDEAKEKWKEGWKAGKADAKSGSFQPLGGGSGGPVQDSSSGAAPDELWDPGAGPERQQATDNPNWLEHQNAAGLIAQARLQIRYEGVTQGVQWFRDDADGMIKSVIQKPPGKISVFGTFVEVLIPALEVLLPEETLAMNLFTVAKTMFESAKPGTDLMDKLNEEHIANTVEEARDHMEGVVNDFAEDVTEKAGRIHQAIGDQVPEALRTFVDAHPQHFSDEDSFHEHLVDLIGIKEPDLDAVKKETYDKVFPQFKAELLKTTAQMHFFHDLDDDGERFRFLVEGVIKVGTDPDQFLTLIGADKPKFDRAIEVWRQFGADDEATRLIADALTDTSGSVLNPLRQPQ